MYALIRKFFWVHRLPLSTLLLLVVNLAIVGKLFGVEYSAYNNSIEGTFIAIPRIMAKYPMQWSSSLLSRSDPVVFD